MTTAVAAPVVSGEAWVPLDSRGPARFSAALWLELRATVTPI